MNEDMIKKAYDSMTPDEAARQRMLKRIIIEGEYNMTKEYSAQPQKNKGWMGPAAAILVLACLIVGMVTMLNRDTSSQLSSDQTVETADRVHREKSAVIQEFMNTPFYRAAMEYTDQIRQDGAQSTYVRETLATVAERYSMKWYDGDDVGTDSYDHFLESVKLDSFLRNEKEGVLWSVESCWWYDEMRFNVAGSVTMAWENTPRAMPVDFNFFRTTPEYVFHVFAGMGHLEECESWEYPLISGETAILVQNGEASYVIVYRPDEVFVIVADNWKQDEADRDMSREALEAFAELFSYEMIARVHLESTDIEVEITPEISAYPYFGFDDLANCTAAVSLQPDDIWQEASGEVFMNVTIYCYDLYDLVDISKLDVGDYIFIRWQPVEITALDRVENGDVLINGGSDAGGYTLRTDEDGVYYEVADGGEKYWQEYAVTTIAVSPDFRFRDNNGLVCDTEIFLELDYYGEFTPDNTTLVIENGVIVAMERTCTSETEAHRDEQHHDH